MGELQLRCEKSKKPLATPLNKIKVILFKTLKKVHCAFMVNTDRPIQQKQQ